jgi:SAM-dependent methyltransferase
MTTEPARAGADWLALREPADAAARAPELVEELRHELPADRTTEVHDLGCGTGSMARWLAPQLAGPQHWVLHDRDADLLVRAGAQPPRAASDGAPVTLETRHGDITRLDPDALAGASLLTASALLDMMTTEELDRLVAACAAAACPALFTLSVIGDVELLSEDPLDRPLMEAFNDHQRRDTGAGRLLGPDAVAAAVDGLTGHGFDVVVRASPWRLGAEQSALVTEWFRGWLAAACEQQPALAGVAGPYGRRRLAELADGRLHVTVHHQDFLARPLRRR